MIWPFENDTSNVIKKLAIADLKSHKLKTFLSGSIITIATCLMAVVFSVLINDGFSQANSSTYHAMYRSVDDEIVYKLYNDSDFESVGIYKNFGETIDKNEHTQIVYMDTTAMNLLGFQLLDGNYPMNINEVAISSTYMEKYGLSIGDTFDLTYTNIITNHYEKKHFTICGVLENKKQETGNIFSILTSDNFRIAFAKQSDKIKISSFSTQTPTSVDILLKLNTKRNKLNIEEQKEYLKQKGYALGVKNYNIILNDLYIEGFFLDTTVLIGITFFTLFLMFASSFVIYSIFYISIVNSIPMYAQMISLGTTKKQLRYFFKSQGNILSFCFIPLGLIISLIIILIISGTEWFFYDTIISIISGLLIFAVIKFALRKPIKTLYTTSLIEVMKHTNVIVENKHKSLKKINHFTLAKNNLFVNKKKNNMAITSLSISGTLMIAFSILISSIDIPNMLLQSFPLNEDFQIGIKIDNFYEYFPKIIQNNPLSYKLVNEISNIPGVEKVIKDECLIGKIQSPKISYENTGDTKLEIINSVSPELLANVSKKVAGSINYSDIASNGIIINKYRVDHSTLNYNELKVGDTIQFQFETNGIISKKVFKVIGIAYFPSTGLFYTSSEIINTISPFTNVSHLSIFCDEAGTKTIKKALQNIISKNPNLKLLVYVDEYNMIIHFIQAVMSSLYGISAFIVLFGLLNMVNTLINSAIIRRREFALLQAVGMTNRQLRKMLYFEGIYICAKSIIIATIMGIVLGRLFCYLANEVMAFKFIIFKFSILPIFIFAILLIVVQTLVSFYICRAIERNTLTERLRV